MHSYEDQLVKHLHEDGMLEEIDMLHHHHELQSAKHKLLKAYNLVKPADNLSLLTSVKWVSGANGKRTVPFALQQMLSEVSFHQGTVVWKPGQASDGIYVIRYVSPCSKLLA